VSRSAAERSLREEKEGHQRQGSRPDVLLLDRFTTRRWALGAIGVSTALAIAGSW
jgi:hypothetical protein